MSYIEQCEQEQLHLCGEIQPHGALLVISAEGNVNSLSSNIHSLLSLESSLVIGQPIPSELTDLIASTDYTKTHQYRAFLDAHQRQFDVTVSKQDDIICLEFIPTPPAAPNSPDSFQLPAVLHDSSEKDLLRKQLLKWIQNLTGHERVIYYQFMENGDGHVLEEVCINPEMGSYLDLRFPASDIPKIARTLYCQNPWREIPAARQNSLPILGDGTHPDLTHTDLRSVSPIHRQYMANMGIDSSVSFPLTKQGNLDALVSCHSSDPHKLPLYTLRKVAKTCRSYNLLQRELDTRQRQILLDEFSSHTHPIQKLLNSGAGLAQIWEELCNELIHYFNVDGVILCGDSWAFHYGATLNQEALEHLDYWFMNSGDSRAFWSDHLKGLLSDLPLTEVAGVAGIKFQPRTQGFPTYYRLYLCRGEHIHEVSWGGNPNKPVENLSPDSIVSPRISFSKWVEKRLGYSHPWCGTIDIQLHQFRQLLEVATLNLDIHS